VTHSCQLLAISLACLIADVAGSGAQDAKPEKATAATQAATPDRPAAVPAAANTVPPKPITFEVGKTKVSVSEGTEADGRNALAVATKFLKLWHENDVENAVELAVPHMRDGFHNQMTKNKLASPEVTALGVFRGRHGTLVGRVHVATMSFDMKLDGDTWMIGSGSPRPDRKPTPQAGVPSVPNTPEPPLSYWIDQLKAGKGDRRSAFSALLRVGPEAAPAVPVLIEALGDADESVRDQAALVLGLIRRGAKEAVPALAKATKDKSPTVRLKALEALGRIGPDAASAVPVLVEAIQGSDPSLRVFAIQAVYGIGPDAEGAIPALIAALRDSDKIVRLHAAQALANMGPKAKPAVPALIEAVSDPDSAVRSMATAAFVRMGPAARDAIPALIKAVEGDDAELRRQAAYTLSTFGAGAEPAVPTLIAALKSDFKTRKDAIRTLGTIGPSAKASIPALRQIVEQTSALYLRVEAADALARIDRAAVREVVPLLMKTLQDPDSGVRMSSAKALGKIGPDAESALPALRELLDDPTVDVGQIAAEAIGRIEQK